jgi:hypothetical protein
MAVMVAVMLLSSAAVPALLVGVALFAGMGLVFFLIYLLARERRALSWALVPATALTLMALVALAAHLASTSPGLAAGVRFWPTLLLILGLVLVGYGLTRGGKPAEPPGELPPQPAAVDRPAAPGAADTSAPLRQPAAPPARVERAPITLHDPQPPAAGQEGTEEFDIYDFLKSAPPGE